MAEFVYSALFWHSDRPCDDSLVEALVAQLSVDSFLVGLQS